MASMFEITIVPADTGDAGSILALQKVAYQSEAQLYRDWSIPPLTQTLPALVEEFSAAIVLKAMCGDMIVGSVRATIAAGVCHIGRLIVHPDFQRKGIGTRLLSAIEAQFPAAAKYELFTGSLSGANIRLYRRHGYAIQREEVLSETVTLVFMEK